MSGQWFRYYRRTPGARTRLICFPSAGGGASTFRSWADTLPSDVDLAAVQYPGRENRLGDPLIDNMGRLVDEVAEALVSLLDRPYVLLGHSMGGAVAYEVAHRLRDLVAEPPARLVVCGREAPSRIRPGNVHQGDDEMLRAELERLGGTPPEIFEEPELCALVFPYVRNDYRLIENYRPHAGQRLSCPISAFVGDSDPDCTLRDAEAWSENTTEPLDLRRFPGGHFFVDSAREKVLAAVSELLGRPAARPSQTT